MAQNQNRKNKTMEDYYQKRTRLNKSARIIALVIAVVMIGFSFAMALLGWA